MQYVCLVYVEESKLGALTKSESDALASAALASDDELRKRGHYVFAQALQPAQTEITVRVRNNRLSTTDGPFAETREQLGGFIQIEARDLNEAIQIAANIPMASLGCIEVRPTLELAELLEP
jgi:hypothetical protein